MSKPRIIAFYLPQFHPFKENDEWWGKGFTEWTNVGKAKALFNGYNQPRIPTELGYYDLRLPIVREQQAQMAKDAGVTAFCYWHYWFGNGKRLMADIFDEVLNTGKPDFPFCLGWANHSWFAKNWNSDGTSTNKILIEQTYPGILDEEMHFSFLLRAFQDSRYVKIDGAPLLYIFDPINIPQEYLDNFRRWTKRKGFPDLYLIANIAGANTQKIDILQKGFNAVTYQRLGGITNPGLRKMKRFGRGVYKVYKKCSGFVLHRPPFTTDYRKYYPLLITKEDKEENVIPSLVPQWDHTPRSGWNGTLFTHAEPEFFYKHSLMAIDAVKNKKHPMLFLKSWNEWGRREFHGARPHFWSWIYKRFTQGCR